MKRMLALLITASFTLVACDGRIPQSVASPTGGAQASTGATDGANQYAVGGMVQSIEKPTRAVSGAVIEVTQGVNRGKFAVSDDSGSFAIYGLAPGAIKVQVSKGAFDVWASKDFDLQADTKIAVELFPAAPRNSSGAAATGRCKDGTWTWTTSRTEACVNSGGVAYGVCPGPLCKSGM
jgi:pectin methylesterase-like acyl-CoA thioesterase